MKWSRSLACCAWGVFALSFFLPAAEGMRGWECAGYAVSFTGELYQDAFKSLKQLSAEWDLMHVASLTFANLFMVISPFLLWRTPRKARIFNWPVVASFTACVLVWSYYFRVLLQASSSDLKIGFYLWALSFLLLFLASILRSLAKSGRAADNQLTAPSTSRASANPAPADM